MSLRIARNATSALSSANWSQRVFSPSEDGFAAEVDAVEVREKRREVDEGGLRHRLQGVVRASLFADRGDGLFTQGLPAERPGPMRWIHEGVVGCVFRICWIDRGGAGLHKKRRPRCCGCMCARSSAGRRVTRMKAKRTGVFERDREHAL